MIFLKLGPWAVMEKPLDIAWRVVLMRHYSQWDIPPHFAHNCGKASRNGLALKKHGMTPFPHESHSS